MAHKSFAKLGEVKEWDYGSDSEASFTETEDLTSEVSLQGPSIEDLQNRCEFLLSELKGFANHIRSLGREHAVELRGPSGAVEAELKSLKKLSNAKESADIRARTKHILRSSNIPYHEAVWATAKRSTGVIAFNKRFFWHVPKRAQTKTDLKSKYKRSALVDVVCQNGAEWIKVSTITETRLIFELARQGWASADQSSGSEEDKSSRSSLHNAGEDSDDEDMVSILRMAQDLSRASKSVRVRYRHPSVRFVLPKIEQGRLKEIDKLLESVRAEGISVETNVDIDVTTPDLESALPTMLVDEFADFSTTLNIDCTILLALVSDLSHAHIETKPWFPRATARQIEMEKKETLLPSSLYPAMGSHALVCTKEAADRMREIVSTIGTPSEKARTAILLGDDATSSQAELVQKFRECSDYEVPSTWQLPIRVVDKSGDDAQAHDGTARLELPEVAVKVGQALSAINQSVFLYGWRTLRTTVTSNRTVARQIEEVIEANRGSDESSEEVIGPPLWLCPMARSLVGKEKNREKGMRRAAERQDHGDIEEHSSK